MSRRAQCGGSSSQADAPRPSQAGAASVPGEADVGGGSADYSTVTEAPGNRISPLAVSMMRTRYGFAAGYCTDKDVLEVACGCGQGLGYLARTARSVTGGDFTGSLVRLARNHYGERLPVLCLDAHKLPFADESADVVILFEALYYLARPDAFLAECQRVLRPGGRVILCSANPEWADFNPSPHSVRYLSACETEALLRDSGFSAEVFGAYSTRPQGVRDHVVSSIKRIAVALHLIPKTMKGKQLLKRIFIGKLVDMPVELDIDEADVPRPVPVDTSASSPQWKVIYATGAK